MIVENEDIMAAAEARAAWQRTANRCFVQEDAKRAPKFACCPSSSTQQNEINIADATNVQDKCVSSFMPLNINFTNSNLPSDTKWWLQTQPNFGYSKDFMYELKGLSNDHVQAKETTNHASFTDEALLGACMEHDLETQIQEMKELTNSLSQLKHKVESGACYLQQELLDTKPFEPWWRVSDREELASFVAQKSLENIENCDLPRPAHTCRNPFTCFESWDGNGIFSPFGCNLDAGMCLPTDYREHSSGFREMDRECLQPDHANHPPFATEKMASDSPSSNTSLAESTESQRTRLLEALSLSQTRARNAEMAAQKACDEKDHIVKLLLKQASHLFAYKQWMHILQLESLFLRLRTEDRRIASVFPALPWMPLKAKEGGVGSRRKGKKKQKKCRLCRYALLLAVGLGLAGAGLLLGCCLGWLSPTAL